MVLQAAQSLPLTSAVILFQSSEQGDGIDISILQGLFIQKQNKGMFMKNV
jgi:hypothetical protein